MAFNLCSNRIGHWHLNESSGTNVPDNSGKGNNGTTQNMEDGDWVAGKLNNALQFDGVNEYVNCGDIANFERNELFSLECWLKTTLSGYEVIIGRSRGVSPYTGHQLYFAASFPGKIIFELIGTVGGQSARIMTTSTYNDGGWHHVVATYNGTSTTAGMNIYVDGSLAGVTSESNTLASSILNSVNFQISGKDVSTLPFNGQIDEVVIYDKELSQTEVTGRYNSGAGTESCSIPGGAMLLGHDF